MKISLSVLAVLWLCPQPRAQAPDVLVLSRGGTGATEIYGVDTVTATVTRLPRFPGDTARPLAIGWDPIDGRALVAVDLQGFSEVWRVSIDPNGPPFARPLAVVPGTASQLEIGPDADILIATRDAGGGIWRMGRDGSGLRLVAALPFVSFFSIRTYNSAGLALTSPPGTTAPPSTAGVNVDIAAVTSGPAPFMLPAGQRATGLLTNLVSSRDPIVSTDQGELFAINSGFATRVPLRRPLMPGATQRMRLVPALPSDFAYLLGDRRDPVLRRIIPAGSLAGVATRLPIAIPNEPVDFAVRFPSGTLPLPFGPSCGPEIAVQGRSNLGAVLSLDLTAAPPLAPASAIFGVSEQSWFGGALPMPLPISGCSLLVRPNLGLPTTTDAQGAASLPLTVPNNASLIGARFFFQWIVDPTLQSSDAVALLIGA